MTVTSYAHLPTRGTDMAQTLSAGHHDGARPTVRSEVSPRLRRWLLR